MVNLRFLLFLIVAVIWVGGCGSRQPRINQLGPDELYTRGMAAYEQERYGRAIPLLERFALQHLGDPRVPEARITLARTHLARRDYIPAAAEFQRVVTDFPTHPLAQEARFGLCESYNRLSPKPPLDQEYTQAALIHCESVASLYPDAEEGRQAGEYVTELREKLAKKAYDSGLFYFKRGAYDAAVIYFEDVVDQFPQTSHAPAALMKLWESFTRIGYVEEADEVRDRLMREYPQSAEAEALRA